MRQAEYFDRRGRSLTAQEARDHNGIIRDGVTVRVRMQMRDSASQFTDARQFWDRNKATLVVTDAAALGGTKGNQPGFRILDSAVNAQDRADAYQQYNDDLTNAWRTPPPPTGAGASGPRGVVSSDPPPGAYPYSAAAEGAACTVNGRPGHLVRQGNALVCTPTTTDARTSDGSVTCPDCDGDGELDDGEECPRCEGSGEIDTDDDEYEDGQKPRRRGFPDDGSRDRALSLDQMRASHASNMDKIYQQITHELENAWKEGK